MDAWINAIATFDANGTAHVLVTQVEVMGSTPREAGAKMVVSMDSIVGTIGGGSLEFQAAAEARGMLAEGRRQPKIDKSILGPDMRQCCGGAVTLLFEPFFPPALTIALFGAGHVAQALVKVLEGVPLRLTWIDERDLMFPRPLPAGVRALVREDPLTAIPEIAAGTHVRVMTHSHERDFRLVQALAQRDDLGSLGLIGSATKWARFRRRFAEGGLSDAQIGRIQCPIGIPGIMGKRPAEIAISVAAQLLQKGM